MRIVGGELRGRRLRPPAAGTRPTADRVREALFSILGDVSELAVLDLFAGSGALGIEALSRGARSAEFVDSGRRACEAIRRNLEQLGLEARVHRRDALRFLTERAEAAQFDIVFADPPYDLAPRMAHPLAKQLPLVLADNARIVTESDKRSLLGLPFPLLCERVYGDTRIAVHSGP